MSSDLNSGFDSLEARMASFRARTKADSQRYAGEEAKQQQIDADYDAFITPISDANVISPSSAGVSSRTRMGSDGTRQLHRSSVSLSNISRQDDGWSSQQGEKTPVVEGIAAHSPTSAATIPHHTRQSSGSSNGPLVLSYNSDNGGNPSARGSGNSAGGSTHRKRSDSSNGTENAGSWAEALAMQQKASESARKRGGGGGGRGGGGEGGAFNGNGGGSGGYGYGNGTGGGGGGGSGSGGYGNGNGNGYGNGSGSGPLSARGRGYGEGGGGGGGGQIVAASGSQILGALASYERRQYASRSSSNQPLTAREFAPQTFSSPPRASAGPSGFSSFRAQHQSPPSLPYQPLTSRTHQQRSHHPNNRMMDDDHSRSRGSNPPLTARSASRQGGSLRQGVDRRLDIEERKERVRQKKEAALRAITIASTPVSEGGTLGLKEKTEGQTSASAPSATTNPRGCEVLGMGDNACAIQ